MSKKVAELSQCLSGSIMQKTLAQHYGRLDDVIYWELEMASIKYTARKMKIYDQVIAETKKIFGEKLDESADMSLKKFTIKPYIEAL